MALSKNIKQQNGITLKYHRIESLNILTNQCNIISVASYLSQSTRQDELDAYALAEQTGEGIVMDVIIRGFTYEAPYDQDMTIAKAYEWVKDNAPEFKGAKDILEDEDDNEDN